MPNAAPRACSHIGCGVLVRVGNRCEAHVVKAWSKPVASTYIERLDWRECIERYDRPHTFLYLDPPYWQTDGYGVPFPFDQYVAMADVMRSLKGKAILSLNDHPDIRACFAGMHMESLDISYQVAGGHKAVDRRELLVWSWDLAAEPASLF